MGTNIPVLCVLCALANDFATKIFSMGILVAGVFLSPTYSRISNLKAYPLQGRESYHIQQLGHKQARMSYLKFSNTMKIIFKI